MFALFATCIVLCGLTLAADAQNACNFLPALRGYRKCFREEVGEVYFTYEPIKIMTQMCSVQSQIAACVQNFAQDCTNGDVIVNETRAFLGICDANNKLAGWVKNSVPTEELSEKCDMSGQMRDLATEVECMQKALQVYASLVTSSLEDGLTSARSLKAIRLGCVKSVLQSSDYCPAVSWKTLYNRFVGSIMAQPPLLGIYLTPGDFAGVQGGGNEEDLRRLARAMEPSYLLTGKLKLSPVTTTWRPRVNYEYLGI